MPATRWEKIRFFVSLFVCLAVIMGSAIWAYALREKGAPALAKPAAERVAPRAALLRPVAGEALRGVAAVCWEETLGCFAAHEGVDLAAEAGAEVKAAADGEVATVYEDDAMGTTVVIRHADGYTTKYASLAENLTVKPGDIVTMGQVIGYASDSAIVESTLGSHVHFGVTCNDVPVYPAEFLALGS